MGSDLEEYPHASGQDLLGLGEGADLSLRVLLPRSPSLPSLGAVHRQGREVGVVRLLVLLHLLQRLHDAARGGLVGLRRWGAETQVVAVVLVAAGLHQALDLPTVGR